MKKTTFLMGAALAACLTSSLAMAQGADAAKPSAPPNLPAPLQLTVQAGMKVERTFEAAGGLTGWILSQGPGQNLVVYTTPDGSAAIAGNMVNAQGQNLTEQYMEKYAPKIDYSKFWDRLEKSSYAAEGASDKDAKKVIYVFKDANCGYCHQARNDLLPYMTKGLQVRWVMVAVLGRDSANKAAAVLEAKDKRTVLSMLHSEWGKPSSFSATTVTPETKAKLDANLRLMTELGIDGTPSTLYKDQTGAVRLVKGAPRPHLLGGITGIDLASATK